MSAQEETKFKVCFKDEVRRIPLPNLAALVQFISSIPSWPQTFFVQYKDDEGDTITISSDKELKEALQFATSGKPLRLEVVEAPADSDSCFVKGKIPESAPEGDALEEPGVVIKKSDLEDLEHQPSAEAEQPQQPQADESPAPAVEAASVAIAAPPAAGEERKEETVEHKMARLTSQLASVLQEARELSGSALRFQHTHAAFAKELAVAFGLLKVEESKEDAKVAHPPEKPAPAASAPAKAAPAPVPAPASATSSKWDEQLALLIEMGYTDTAALIPLLDKYKGDVQRAIAELV